MAKCDLSIQKIQVAFQEMEEALKLFAEDDLPAVKSESTGSHAEVIVKLKETFDHIRSQIEDLS